jgi:hypothetical protein
MAVSFTPFKANQTSASGDTLQTQGNNIIANHSTSSPYTVPDGTDYVLVSSDAAFTVTATPLYDGKGGQTTGYSARLENAGQIEVPNVIGGKTTITVS